MRQVKTAGNFEILKRLIPLKMALIPGFDVIIPFCKCEGRIFVFWQRSFFP